LTLRVPDEGYSINYLASYSLDLEGTWWRLFINYLASYSFDFEGTWWRLFQKLFDFLFFWPRGYLMKVIWLPILLTLRVPDEGYSSFLFFWPWGYLMKVIPETRHVH
jgi:hypothetical protein